jgi:hypothetical protein
MTGLFELLKLRAQKELVRSHVIELMSIVARAVPNPNRPDDTFSLKITAGMKSEFAPGEPWIDAKIDRLRKVCNSASDDFSTDMRDALVVVLNRKGKEPKGMQAGTGDSQRVPHFSNPQVMKLFGQTIPTRSQVTLWCLAWTVEMDDDGMLQVDCEDCFSRPGSRVAVEHLFEKSIYAEDMDGKSLEKIMARMGTANAIMDRVVERFITRRN